MKHLVFLALLLIPQLAESAPKSIRVFIALCDNKTQGIIPVGEKIGDGDKPDANLKTKSSSPNRPSTAMDRPPDAAWHSSARFCFPALFPWKRTISQPHPAAPPPLVERFRDPPDPLPH